MSKWRAIHFEYLDDSWWSVEEVNDHGQGMRPIVYCGDDEDLARRIAKLPELEAIIGEMSKTADGVRIKEGHRYFFPCANGLLEFWAYLSPVTEQTDPYPWDKSYSNPKAAKAARKEGDRE